MASPATIVRLLWNAARAVGAARAATQSGRGQQLARNIVKFANQVRKGNQRLQELSDDDEEAIARELDREGVDFEVGGERFTCGGSDFLE